MNTTTPDNTQARPGSSDGPGSSDEIEHKLVQAWRRGRRFVDLRGLAHVFLWVAGLFAIDFALDWSLNLTSRARMALLGVNVLILAGVIYFRWLRHVSRYNPVRTALAVETRYPQLKSLLVSYVQLRNRSGEETHTSGQLLQAMREQAVAVASPIDFGQIVRFHVLKPLAVLCGVVVVFGGLAVWRGSELVEVFLGRMTDPRSNLRYPTKTLLEPVTRDAVVQEGRSFAPAALASGEIPTNATLTIRPLDGESENVIVAAGKEKDATGKRPFTYNLGDVYHSFTYSFRIGDAAGDPFTVTVVPPPRLKSKVTIDYPEYTHRKTAVSASLTAEVLEGSRIEWECEFDRPLAQADLVLDGEKTLSMTLDPSGRVARARLGGPTESLTKSFSYSFRWKDRDHGFSYAPAAQYTIQVAPDRAPRVALASPGRDVSATAQKVVDVRAEAKDDYGLSSARLVISVTNNSPSGKGSLPETILPIKTEALNGEPPKATLSLKVPLLKSIPDLAPGDVVNLAVEVSDNRPGNPSVTRSETRRITILSPADYLAYIQRQRDRLLSQIRDLQAVETNAAETLDEELKSLDKDLEKSTP